MDHADPAGPTLDLALGRRRAKGDRIGTLLVNPGGPGAAGIPIVQDAESYFSNALLDRFDIVAWDPRGSGDSTAIDCGNKLDYFFDTDKSPDDAGGGRRERRGRAQARERVRGTQRRAAAAPVVRARLSTTWTRSAPRSARRSSRTSASRTAPISARSTPIAIPTHVRALVLDGALDPSLGFEDVTRDQAVGFDSALNAFLDNCARTDCGFGGSDPHRAYDRLIAQIDAEPLPGEVGGEHRTLGPGEADLGVASALYAGTQGWSILADALKRAARGDGTTLLAALRRVHRTQARRHVRQLAGRVLRHRLPRRAGTDDRTAAGGRAADRAGRAGVRRVDHVAVGAVLGVARARRRVSPRRCTRTGAPPIVVLGTSNDPATPLKWAQALANQLESGHLVVYRGRGPHRVRAGATSASTTRSTTT